MKPSSLENHHLGKTPRSARDGNCEGVRAQYKRAIRRKWLVVLAVAVVMLGLSLASLLAGSSDLSVGHVLAALFGAGDDYTTAVVWKLRMPRVAIALLGGVALALAGCTFQGVLRNPLASASTLGIAQGAAFGAALSIIVVGAGGAAATYDGVNFDNPFLTAIFAFAGAMASTLVILGLSRLRDMTPESIVLAGVAISALFTGATALIQYFADDAQVAAVVFWTFGDLGRVSGKELAICAVVVVASAVFFWANRWNYNAMDMGDGSAHGLGVNVNRTRVAGMLVAAAASSCIIAFCGTINFVGLIAPHIMRRLVGSDFRYLLPASACAGACVLLLSDLVARLVMPPVILPISAITSFIGAPLFLYLLMRGAHR